MVEVEIDSGICGFKTVVQADNKPKYKAGVFIESTCPHVTKLAEKIKELGEIDVMKELFKKGESQILAASNTTLPHITCPVPVGILKCLEVSTGMALPKDVTITFRQ